MLGYLNYSWLDFCADQFRELSEWEPPHSIKQEVISVAIQALGLIIPYTLDKGLRGLEGNIHQLRHAPTTTERLIAILELETRVALVASSGLSVAIMIAVAQSPDMQN